MNSKLATICFVIGALLVPAATHAANSDSDGMHSMMFVKDSTITTKIKGKLAEERTTSPADIKVETYSDGAVVLSGNVRTKVEADQAVSVARETEGVTSVETHIRIKGDK